MMLVLTSLMLHFAGEERRGNGLFTCVSLLWALYAGMLISTFFSPAFYSVTDAAVYIRGPWYPFLLIPPLLIMLLNLLGLWRRRKKLNRSQLMAFRVYILFPLLSMLVQMLYYGILATTLIVPDISISEFNEKLGTLEPNGPAIDDTARAGFSVGFVRAMLTDSDMLRNLIARADEKMYESKREKNCVS